MVDREVVVRTVEPDPDTTTNPDALLTERQTDWPANQGDVPRGRAVSLIR